MKKLFFVLLTAVVLTGCNEDDNGDGNKNITLAEGTPTSQTVYADQTNGTGGGGIEFNAIAPWTATVVATPVARAAGSDVDWLSLNSYSGGAGKQTLSMTISENTTGEPRKAEIKIDCGGTTVSIAIEQKGVTANNEVYTPVITLGGKGEIIIANIQPAAAYDKILFSNYNSSSSDTLAFYHANNGKFSLNLPTPTKLTNIMQDYFPGLSKSNMDAKGYVAYMKCTSSTNTEGEMYYTNAADHNNLAKGEYLSLPELVYMDREVTITGMIKGKDKLGYSMLTTYNMTLKKGWNLLIETVTARSSGTVDYAATANNAPKSGKWFFSKLDQPLPHP